MKLSPSNLLNPLSQSACQRVSRHFFASRSTKSLFSHDGSNTLYRRISPLGDPNTSVVPVLDQWVEEGRDVTAFDLRSIVKELIAYKRFKHALEVSQWMTDRRYINLVPKDVAVRINLMFRLHGLKEAENYFNNVHQRLKDSHVYFALLNCYAKDGSVEKAEAIMQKVREMGYALATLPYNIMMNLYYSVGNWKKLDDLMNEMEEKDINFDQFTLTIRLSAYAAASDAEGVDKIVSVMESSPQITLDFSSYCIAAYAYLKVGQVEKVLAILKKMEKMINITKRRNLAFDLLLKLYAKTGEKDELYRIWTMYKQGERVNNKGYMSMMNSLLKFGDIEGVEKIFEEWESRGLLYDFQVTNILIKAYCSNGNLGKAEALLNWGLSEGGNPRMTTWYYMASRYLQEFQISKAMEALKKAISIGTANDRPTKESLTTCVDYLERKLDVEKTEEFRRFLKEEDLFSTVDHDRLLHFLKHGEST